MSKPYDRTIKSTNKVKVKASDGFEYEYHKKLSTNTSSDVKNVGCRL